MTGAVLPAAEPRAAAADGHRAGAADRGTKRTGGAALSPTWGVRALRAIEGRASAGCARGPAAATAIGPRRRAGRDGLPGDLSTVPTSPRPSTGPAPGVPGNGPGSDRPRGVVLPIGPATSRRRGGSDRRRDLSRSQAVALRRRWGPRLDRSALVTSGAADRAPARRTEARSRSGLDRLRTRCIRAVVIRDGRALTCRHGPARRPRASAGEVTPSPLPDPETRMRGVRPSKLSITHNSPTQFKAEVDVHEPAQPAPDDHVPRRWVLRSRQVAPSFAIAMR